MFLNYGVDVIVIDDVGDIFLYIVIYVGSERLVWVSIVIICFIYVFVYCLKFLLLWL